eukprot:TRINITY_DN1536_c0_g1_i1.p1 TRINITY_DN1536_c0_g1~~TRINITY_DN1536_c0_g1_i1.p1  ORF type:complete len:616 (+),score=184.11 TRINITY_DN1536_c0_g1_i1:45-1892(+)
MGEAVDDSSADELMKLTLPQLKDMCKECGLQVSGTKRKLSSRLVDHRRSAATQQQPAGRPPKAGKAPKHAQMAPPPQQQAPPSLDPQYASQQAQQRQHTLPPQQQQSVVVQAQAQVQQPHQHHAHAQQQLAAQQPHFGALFMPPQHPGALPPWPHGPAPLKLQGATSAFGLPFASQFLSPSATSQVLPPPTKKLRYDPHARVPDATGAAPGSEATRTRTSLKPTSDPEGVYAPRPFHAAVVVGDELLVLGGDEPSGAPADGPLPVATYSFMTNAWSHLLLDIVASDPPPSARSRHTAVFHEPSSTVYVFGGEAAGGRALNDLYALVIGPVPCSPARWRRVHGCRADTTVPPPRAHHSAVVVGGRMYVFGGEAADVLQLRRRTGGAPADPADWCTCGFRGALCCNCQPPPQPAPLGDLWAFTFATGLWERVPAFGAWPSPRYSHVSSPAPAASGRTASFFIAGGVCERGREAYADLWEFDAATGRWAELSSRGAGPTALRHGAACCSATELIVFNDENSTAVHTAHALTVATLQWADLKRSNHAEQNLWLGEPFAQFSLRGATAVVHRQAAVLIGVFRTRQPPPPPSPATATPSSVASKMQQLAKCLLFFDLAPGV